MALRRQAILSSRPGLPRIGLDEPQQEGGFWMNHMDGWMGGGMWIWTVIGVLVVVLLIVVISKQSNK